MELNVVELVVCWLVPWRIASICVRDNQTSQMDSMSPISSGLLPALANLAVASLSALKLTHNLLFAGTTLCSKSVTSEKVSC